MTLTIAEFNLHPSHGSKIISNYIYKSTVYPSCRQLNISSWLQLLSCFGTSLVTPLDRYVVMGSPFSLKLIVFIVYFRKSCIYVIADSQLLYVSKLKKYFCKPATQISRLSKIILSIKRLRAFFAERILFNIVDTIIVGYLDYRYINKIFKPRKLVFYCPNGLQRPVLHHSTRNKFKNDNPSPFLLDKINVIFCGNLDYEPNKIAIKNFVLIAKAFPSISFYILGKSSTPIASDLISANLNYLGYVDNITPYFLHADFFYSPMSIQAGCPNKLLDALSYNLPVLATAGLSYCFHPKVRNNFGNLLFKPFDSHHEIITSYERIHSSFGKFRAQKDVFGEITDKQLYDLSLLLSWTSFAETAASRPPSYSKQ